jgi:hypothetical protein
MPIDFDKVQKTADVVLKIQPRFSTMYIAFAKIPDVTVINELVLVGNCPGCEFRQFDSHDLQFVLTHSPAIDTESLAQEIARCLMDEHGMTAKIQQDTDGRNIPVKSIK